MAARQRKTEPSTGKKSLSPEQAERVRQLLERVVEERFSTKTEAAKALGVSQPFLSQVLKGVHGAGMTVLHGLSRLTGRSIDDLMHGDLQETQALDGPEPKLSVEQAAHVRSLVQRLVDELGNGKVASVATALGVLPMPLSNFLADEAIIPGFRFLAMLSDFTGYSPGEILTGATPSPMNAARRHWRDWAPEAVGERDESVPARALPGWSDAVEVVRKHHPEAQAWAVEAAGDIRVELHKFKSVTPAFVLDLARFAFQFMSPEEREQREKQEADATAARSGEGRPDTWWLGQSRTPEDRLVIRGDGTAEEVRAAIEAALADGSLLLVEGPGGSKPGPWAWAEKAEDGSIETYLLNRAAELIVASNLVRRRLRA
jgi:transcriptional regulator with XRE-family HTH domain